MSKNTRSAYRLLSVIGTAIVLSLSLPTQVHLEKSQLRLDQTAQATTFEPQPNKPPEGTGGTGTR
ncbi:hypothetical protein ACQ4M3_07730 [Leptolyngbya sp. AN03gr2]|uniref:hypothetical protein n=1 Tax=unclassified Leptolyngbya TaxID=2650499 RepID=UPI003D30F6AF